MDLYIYLYKAFFLCLYLAEQPLGAAAHGEGVVNVHVVVLSVRRLLHQRLVDLG